VQFRHFFRPYARFMVLTAYVNTATYRLGKKLLNRYITASVWIALCVTS